MCQAWSPSRTGKHDPNEAPLPLPPPQSTLVMTWGEYWLQSVCYIGSVTLPDNTHLMNVKVQVATSLLLPGFVKVNLPKKTHLLQDHPPVMKVMVHFYKTSLLCQDPQHTCSKCGQTLENISCLSRFTQNRHCYITASLVCCSPHSHCRDKMYCNITQVMVVQ